MSKPECEYWNHRPRIPVDRSHSFNLKYRSWDFTYNNCIDPRTHLDWSNTNSSQHAILWNLVGIWYLWSTLVLVFRQACCLSHCSYATWSLLAISELQLSAATSLWPFQRAALLSSWIEVNCLQSATLGKDWLIGLTLLTAWSSFPLQQLTLEQISPSRWQCGKRQASLKAALLLP